MIILTNKVKPFGFHKKFLLTDFLTVRPRCSDQHFYVFGTMDGSSLSTRSSLLSVD